MVNATVTNGLFTAELDFGNQFTGQARWLVTAVKCTGDADFIAQSPRLNMTSSPYAIGLIPGAVVRGSGSGVKGAVLQAVNTASAVVNQFPVDTTYMRWRFAGAGQGFGKDWAVIGLQRNTITGASAASTRGFFRLLNTAPPNGAIAECKHALLHSLIWR